MEVDHWAPMDCEGWGPLKRESALITYQAQGMEAVSVAKVFLSPLPSSHPHPQDSMAKERSQLGVFQDLLI